MPFSPSKSSSQTNFCTDNHKGPHFKSSLVWPSSTVTQPGNIDIWGHKASVSAVKNLPANAGDIGDAGSVLGREDPLEEEMATHSCILAWEIPWTEIPRWGTTHGISRVGHDSATKPPPPLCCEAVLHDRIFNCISGFCPLDVSSTPRVWQPTLQTLSTVQGGAKSPQVDGQPCSSRCIYSRKAARNHSGGRLNRTNRYME